MLKINILKKYHFTYFCLATKVSISQPVNGENVYFCVKNNYGVSFF